MFDLKEWTLQDIPPDFFRIPSTSLMDLFPRPTILHFKGVSSEALYVSVMLHGNEYSAWEALKRFLSGKSLLERDLIVFIGNVEAARASKRFLEGQLDYNRIWKGGERPEHHLAEQVLGYLDSHQKVFAALDVHNNTGRNPLYACVNKIHEEDIKLASLFSSRIVFFLKPDEAHSVALSKKFPAVTLECAKPGNENGINTIVSTLEALMKIKNWNEVALSGENQVRMFHTHAKISLKKGARLSFDLEQTNVDAWVDEEVESYNFEILKKGTPLLKLNQKEMLLEIVSDEGQDVTSQYLDLSGEFIVVKEDFIPSMFTRNIEVIHQDCFGYVMEPMQLLKPF